MKTEQFTPQPLWGGGKIINSVLESRTEDFYISYNSTDIAIYGDVTTALVKGQMQHFYILNGDHREAYGNLIERGFGVCMDYFKANLAQINRNSEQPPTDRRNGQCMR